MIALVVTIIVLLILAGVAISLTLGQNGIFTRAQDAVVINENASIYEQLQMVVVDYQMDAIETKNNQAIIERLKKDGYVNNDNTVNVEKLMGRKMQTGNGSIETGDVYVLEQRQETASSTTSDTNSNLDYYLIYYDDEKVDINLGLAFENKKSMPAYYVEDIGGGAALLDLDGNMVEFEEAYIIYEGERIDVTDCIKTNNNLYMISIFYVVGKIENGRNLYLTTQTFEIVKDGNSYYGDILMIWDE